MKIDMVPWQDQSVWKQIELFFRLSCKNAKSLVEAEHHAAQIAQKIVQVDDIFEDLCNQACPSCAEPCCARATVWFDFRDLLFLYLHTKTIPEKQVMRESGMNCPYLGASGCTLERRRRPFICTWYVCPTQNSMRQKIPKDPGNDLSLLLQKIKAEREMMELFFLGAITAKGDFSG